MITILKAMMLLGAICAIIGTIFSKTSNEVLLNFTILFWIGSYYITIRQLEDK
jgi:hypothetical protein